MNIKLVHSSDASDISQTLSQTVNWISGGTGQQTMDAPCLRIFLQIKSKANCFLFCKKIWMLILRSKSNTFETMGIIIKII